MMEIRCHLHIGGNFCGKKNEFSGQLTKKGGQNQKFHQEIVLWETARGGFFSFYLYFSQ